MMADFAFHFSYRAETWNRLVAEPGDRTQAVRATVEDAGGELRELFYVLGELTGLAIIEAPDMDTASAIALVIMGSGAFTDVRVQPLMTGTEFVAVLERAHAASPGYRLPGG